MIALALAAVPKPGCTGDRGSGAGTGWEVVGGGCSMRLRLGHGRPSQRDHVRMAAIRTQVVFDAAGTHVFYVARNEHVGAKGKSA